VCHESSNQVGAHRKSIVKEALDRLDDKMAIGQSRRDAKLAIREEQGVAWSVSTGLIHSFKTRTVYQEHTIRFVKWARSTHQVLSLAQLDARAEALTTAYLQQQAASGKSPYTLQVERAALRLFFNDRALASDVAIPRRAREQITRARGSIVYGNRLNPDHWQPMIRFLQATGLRRREATDLRCRDISQPEQGAQLLVHIDNGKGGKLRDVPVLPGREQDILQVVGDRAPDARVFDHIPKALRVHALRREYAQALYLHYAPGRALPPTVGRLKRSDYDHEAAQRVSWALGHNRVDVVLRHYIR
jgi:integrase